MKGTRDDFGTALRAWRDRLSPADGGMSSSGGRRVPGLRREELAALAGISVDYITRLEQGRAKTPSAEVVASLARVLQLSTAERDHLYRSAGLLPPQPGQMSTHVPAGVQRLITRLGDIPLAVFSADLSLIMWTPLWASLIGDPLALPPRERNLVQEAFFPATDPAERSRGPVASHGGDALEVAVVAHLRAAVRTYPNDRRLHDLIQRAIVMSSRFAELWASGAVGSPTSERKTIAHRLVGEITLDCDVLTVPGADLRIVAYTAAADTPDAEKLEFLRVMGAHSFPEKQEGRAE